MGKAQQLVLSRPGKGQRRYKYARALHLEACVGVVAYGSEGACNGAIWTGVNNGVNDIPIYTNDDERARHGARAHLCK